MENPGGLNEKFARENLPAANLVIHDLYAHILDEDRKLNAQPFEVAFYANPNMQQVEREISRPAASQGDGLDLQKLFTQLQQNPEVLGQLAALLKSV